MTETVDLTAGIDGATLTQAAAAVYRQLYPRVFTGSTHVSKSGLEFDVSWDVKSPPSIELGPPDDAEAIVSEHLQAFSPPDGVSREQVVAAYVQELKDTTVQLVAGDASMTIAGGGDTQTVPVTLTLYVRVESANGELKLVALKATGTAPNPDDEWFLNHAILPEAMILANRLLPGIELPALSFGAVALTAPAVLITPTHAVVFANLQGRPVPTPPYPSAFPSQPFFALMSDEAKRQIGLVGTSSLTGKTFGKSGDVDIGIGTAKYSASAKLAGVSIAVPGGGGNELQFQGTVIGNVQAGVKVGCTTIGVNYTLIAQPQPSGRIAMSVSGSAVVARTTHLNTFVLLIVPDGSPVEWILSALTTPLLQIITAAFSPLITKAFEGISFAVMALPTIPIDIQGVRLVVSPANVQFSSFAGMTSLEGNATITGG